jgi:hypothetical protein
MKKVEIVTTVFEYDSVNELSQEDQNLIQKSKQGVKNAYAPYSKTVRSSPAPIRRMRHTHPDCVPKGWLFFMQIRFFPMFRLKLSPLQPIQKMNLRLNRYHPADHADRLSPSPKPDLISRSGLF